MVDGTTKSRLTPEAMRELCRRSVAGGLAQFMILVFALSVTSGLRDHPKIFLPIGVLMLLSLVLRLTLGAWLAGHEVGQHGYVQAGLRVGIIASAAAWGAF